MFNFLKNLFARRKAKAAVVIEMKSTKAVNHVIPEKVDNKETPEEMAKLKTFSQETESCPKNEVAIEKVENKEGKTVYNAEAIQEAIQVSDVSELFTQIIEEKKEPDFLSQDFPTDPDPKEEGCPCHCETGSCNCDGSCCDCHTDPTETTEEIAQRVSYEGMTRTQLIDLLRAAGVTGISRKTKDELVSLCLTTFKTENT